MVFNNPSMATYISEDLRFIILNSNEPLVLRNVLNWNLLQWNIEKWSELFDSEELEFRCGKYMSTMEPQWERNTDTVKQNFKEFCNLNMKETKTWLYFDYKYLNRHLKNKKELHDSISWKTFGFPEYSAEESVLWIGSKGAHTPCHKDTYGCNLIAQIYGKKRWILFHPDENLHSTRVPYEESSIYSKLNLFSPSSITVFEDIKHSKTVILEPGEVLFVPNGWWHYVENLDLAISINVWIPLATDPKEQLKESLIQMFVSQIIKDLNPSTQKTILNPNMEELHLNEQSIQHSIDVINLCHRNCIDSSASLDRFTDIQDLLKKHATYIHQIPTLTKVDLINLLQTQAQRFNQIEPDVTKKADDIDALRNIINVFTSEDVINLVTNKLISKKI